MSPSLPPPSQGPHNRLGSNMNGNGKQNEGWNGNRKEREREFEKKIKYPPPGTS